MRSLIASVVSKIVSVLPPLVVLGLAACGTDAVYAHQLTPSECPFYTSAAKAAMQARNAGKPATETVPEMLQLIAACGAKCPVTDGEDTKRIMEFVRGVYMLSIPAGQQIDVEATGAKIEGECEAAARMHDKTMTPDPSVPFTGKQIEG